ncbi:helix-turn-helix domain-containing protein [Fulvivirga aurantia]|uniref:helix-turn-helix domain-containing protein n=1 Tax=Fulvivirga aurantia TaxID=2529383 RepID=UPI001623939D
MNTYLVILISLLMVGLIGKIGELSFDWKRQWKGLSEFAIPFFGPTVYLFIQSTLSKKRFRAEDLFHYIPGVFYCLVVTLYYITASTELIEARIASGELIRVVRILVGLGLTINISYFVLSILRFRSFKEALQRERSYILNVHFVRNLLVAIGACLAVWLVVYIISFGHNAYVEINSRPFIWLAVAFIIMFLAYYQMVSPAVFRFVEAEQEVKYANSKFSHADLDRLKTQLETIMREKEPFLNPKLLKSELAEMMQINAPELSRLLNERIGMSFFEYVNYHRIHKFIALAKSPLIEKKTLLGLAQEAGFHSKSSFNKSFKIVMGCPPSEYLGNS